eukprot:GEZU01015874.1.p1 GENE.GEZU01015874.1~~GEZU01015874.1.p1  ORF type:complete len:152 (-),score=7.06 GEZU01015874.1:156-611(-)
MIGLRQIRFDNSLSPAAVITSMSRNENSFHRCWLQSKDSVERHQDHCPDQPSNLPVPRISTFYFNSPFSFRITYGIAPHQAPFAPTFTLFKADCALFVVGIKHGNKQQASCAHRNRYKQTMMIVSRIPWSTSDDLSNQAPLSDFAATSTGG